MHSAIPQDVSSRVTLPLFVVSNLSGYHGIRSCVVVWMTLGEVCCVLAMMLEVVMVNPVSPKYCIPIPNSLVNIVPPYTIH